MKIQTIKGKKKEVIGNIKESHFRALEFMHVFRVNKRRKK